MRRIIVIGLSVLLIVVCATGCRDKEKGEVPSTSATVSPTVTISPTPTDTASVLPELVPSALISPSPSVSASS